MAPREIRIGSKVWRLPESRGWRIALGLALMIGGVFGFLPILGFWMIPLGFLIVSYDIAIARRARRRAVVWWNRREAGKKRADQAPAGDNSGDQDSERR